MSIAFRRSLSRAGIYFFYACAQEHAGAPSIGVTLSYERTIPMGNDQNQNNQGQQNQQGNKPGQQGGGDQKPDQQQQDPGQGGQQKPDQR